MADSEVPAQDKTKEKKKKKAGSTKEKEPRKKSGAEPELQADVPSTAGTEAKNAQAPSAEVKSENLQQDTPTDSAAVDGSAGAEGTRKSKKSKSAAKSAEVGAGEVSADARKASLSEGATRKASTTDNTGSPATGASRKASAAAPVPEGSTSLDAQEEEEEEEEQIKPRSNELPPVEGTYVPPPAATKRDIDLLQEMDENKLMELKEVFEIFDYDQDGYIDYKDLKLTYQTLGYPDVPEDDISNMLAEAISPLDFDAFVILLGYKTIEMDPETVLIEALACWDYDNSGLISEDRIKHDLMTWGDKFTTEEVEQALEDAPVYVSKKGISMIDYVKFSNTLCGLRKKAKMAPE